MELINYYITTNDVCPKCMIRHHYTLRLNSPKYYMIDKHNNNLCEYCGIRGKDHYTLDHHFKPLTRISSPFDPNNRPIYGYDPLAFMYYPPNGLKEKSCKICGQQFFK